MILSLSELNTIGLLSCSLSARRVLLKAYQPLYLPFWGKKKIFKCLFILNLFIYFFGGGGGRQKQF